MIRKREEMPIRAQEDVVLVRQAVRSWSIEAGFTLVDQTKIVTAASEIARNTLIYGGGGKATLELMEVSPKKGVRLTFEDEGPGIANLDLAMKDGFTTGNGLGLGLSGAKRLSSEFEISSTPGKGTWVRLTRWKG